MSNQLNKSESDETGAQWMLGFADMLSLILTFFVLLFSMSKVNVADWNAVVEVMSDQFNPNRAAVQVLEDTGPVDVVRPGGAGRNLTYLRGLITERLEANPLLAKVELYREGGRLAIAIPSTELFAGKSLTMVDEATDRIAGIGEILVQVPNRIIIAGHTNALRVPAGGLVTDNWQLSLERSRIVAKILNDNRYRRQVTAIGYGDSRLADVSPLLYPTERDAWAERIDFILVDEADGADPFSLQ